MTAPFLIYGVTGYTGRLILAEALAKGLRPVLSGRDANAVTALAEAHGLEARPASLDDHAAMDRALAGCAAVIHCAGPFHRTVEPMLAAVLRNRVSYLDITGEIAVFERLAAADGAAKEAGITLLPGVGFDVVPSDCLAAHLHRRLPDATALTLAFTGGTGVSRGTANTMADGAGEGGAVRRAGRIQRVPAGWRTRTIPFADKPRHCVTIPWGDVSTAWYSTRIPDIEVFTAASPGAVRALRLTRYIGWFLSLGIVKRRMAASIQKRPPGPSEAQRARAVSQLFGQVTNAAGATATATLTAPDGYTLTAKTAVAAVQRLLAGSAAPGFMTPSLAFGADFILEIPGTTRRDVP